MTNADEPTAPIATSQETSMTTPLSSQDDETRPLAYDDPYDDAHPQAHALAHAEAHAEAHAWPAASRRPLRLIPLVLGIIYLGAVLIWGLLQLDLLRAADLDLVLPAVLVIAGGSGLIASLGSMRRDGA